MDEENSELLSSPLDGKDIMATENDSEENSSSPDEISTEQLTVVEEKTPVIEQSVIEKLTDIWEGFQLMEMHNVTPENCQSIEDIKERLTLHVKREMGLAKSTEAVSLFDKFSYL